MGRCVGGSSFADFDVFDPILKVTIKRSKTVMLSA
jgi:hypothetical protein